MPELKQYTPSAPAAVDPTLNLPQTSPELPDSIQKRFGDDASQYDSDFALWWKKVRIALTDGIQNAIVPQVNQNTQAVGNLTQQTDNAFAQILLEQTVRADADAALADQITTVTAAYQLADSIISASVTEEAAARAAADGSIEAMWGVAIDINGNIVGRILLDGTSQSSSFLVAVDKFQVTNPSGTITLLDIRAGGIVFGAAIMSDNFSAGSSGWWVDRNSGNAEFNSIVIRNPIVTTSVGQPTLSPTSTDFTGSIVVTLAAAGGTIRYTTDGSEVTAGSAIYSGALTFTATTTLRSKAYDGGGVPSLESQGTYTLAGGGGGGGPVYTLTIITASPPLQPTVSSQYTAGYAAPISVPGTVGAYNFTNWSGSAPDLACLNGSTTDNPNSVNMLHDIVLTANYSL